MELFSNIILKIKHHPVVNNVFFFLRNIENKIFTSHVFSKKKKVQVAYVLLLYENVQKNSKPEHNKQTLDYRIKWIEGKKAW